jgi:hypothetical protein
MTISSALALFLQAILLLGSALMAWKLYSSGLYRHYPVFFYYCIFRVPNSIWPLLLGVNSSLYQQIWMVTDPLVLGFYLLMVAELYRLVLEKYKGLYTVGRWAMYVSVALALAISLLSLLAKLTPAMPQRTRLMGYFIFTERGIDSSLAIFILLILLFLSRYPIKLSRNVRVHALIYSVFFLSNTVGLFLRMLFGLKASDHLNMVFTAISAGSMIAWLLLLSPAGEEIPQEQMRVRPDQEQRLLTQLDALNASLLRVSRQ